MRRIEVLSAYTHECIGYFGDTSKEKQLCTKILSKIRISQILDEGNTRKVYVEAIALPEK